MLRQFRDKNNSCGQCIGSEKVLSKDACVCVCWVSRDGERIRGRGDLERMKGRAEGSSTSGR